MRSRLTPEHVAEMAIHCTLATAFVGLVLGALMMKAITTRY